MCAYFHNAKMMMHLVSWHLRIDLYDAYKMKLMKRDQHFSVLQMLKSGWMVQMQVQDLEPCSINISLVIVFVFQV